MIIRDSIHASAFVGCHVLQSKWLPRWQVMNCVWKRNQLSISICICMYTVLYLRSTPHPVTVTTRIITFLVGNPYKPSFATVTGWGVDPNYIISFMFQVLIHSNKTVNTGAFWRWHSSHNIQWSHHVSKETTPNPKTWIWFSIFTCCKQIWRHFAGILMLTIKKHCKWRNQMISNE